MTQAIINELKKRAAIEGNGFVITIKRTGKRYAIYFQESGTYHITDKISIWVEEKYNRTFGTLDELAEEIQRIA